MNNGIAQLGGARNRRVLREIALNGGDGCVLNVLRRGKVGLARAEIDHIDSLRAQFFRLGHHRHGGGRFNTGDAVGESQSFGGRGGHAFFFLFLSLVFLLLSTSGASTMFASWNL
jgi:hypothetical protein